MITAYDIVAISIAAMVARQSGVLRSSYLHVLSLYVFVLQLMNIVYWLTQNFCYYDKSDVMVFTNPLRSLAMSVCLIASIRNRNSKMLVALAVMGIGVAVFAYVQDVLEIPRWTPPGEALRPMTKHGH